MKLELKHLAPYLPYGLKIKSNKTGEIFTLTGFSSECGGEFTTCELANILNEKFYGNLCAIKPILRPMSDLHSFMIEFLKEISIIDLSECEFEVGEEPEYYVNAIDKRGVCIDWCDFDENNWVSSNYKNDGQKIVDPIEQSIILFKYQFDVFGLIDASLAIDINTVPELLNG